MRVNFLVKLFNVKIRNEIRNGKLWRITRIWGIDVLTTQKKVVKGIAVVKPKSGTIDAMRVHVIGGENNVTNLTKNPELL
jgi:hypothetical protein